MLDTAQRARIAEAKHHAVTGSEVEAAKIIREIRKSWPASAETECAIAEIFELVGFRSGAIDAYDRSFALDSSYIPSFERLGELYFNLDCPDRACWYARRAAQLRGYDQQSLAALARMQYRNGNLNGSLRTYRRAMRVRPNSVVHGAYIATLLHDPRQSPATLKAANEKWIQTYFPEPPAAPDFRNTRDPERKLRIGYVAGELRSSPGLRFILPLLKAHDRSAVEVFCYHLSCNPDQATKRYQDAVDHWFEGGGPAGLERSRQQILQDRIDVLVELSGHLSSTTGLGIFQKRSAPVQVAYLDYPSTTGCREMDYCITDRWITRDDTFARSYSERAPYYLPSGHLSYEPSPDTPDVTRSPASQNGFVTFGVFQRASKFNADFWAAVARVVRKTPRSNLLIHHANNELEEPDGALRNRVLDQLNAHRVSKSRVQFLGALDDQRHFKAIANVDIALDTFPHSGVTSTCECLWMGVPVVTFAGAIHACRLSAAFLCRVGLTDWVADSIDQYVEIATAKASNLASLAELRYGLRHRMAQSSLARPEVAARELEEGYRWMWRQWCGCSLAA